MIAILVVIALLLIRLSLSMARDGTCHEEASLNNLFLRFRTQAYSLVVAGDFTMVRPRIARTVGVDAGSRCGVPVADAVR